MKSTSLSEVLNNWCTKYAALISFLSFVVSAIIGIIIPVLQQYLQPASQSWFVQNNELIFRGALLFAIISLLFYTYYVYPDQFARRFEGRLSEQILCEINNAVAPGFYRRSTLDQAVALESQAIKILIITDSLKFEKLVSSSNPQEKPIMQVIKEEIVRICKNYYNSNSIDAKQINFKHWYLVPQSKLGIIKKKLKMTYYLTLELARISAIIFLKIISKALRIATLKY